MLRTSSSLLACLFAIGCNEPAPFVRDAEVRGVTLSATLAWQSAQYPGCTYASPILARSMDRDVFLTVDDEGYVRALDPATGAMVWELVIAPDTAGNQVEVLSTPGLILDGHAAILGWQERTAGTDLRVHTRIAVIDLDLGVFHPEFAAFDLAATLPAFDGADVAYRAAFQLLRSAIIVQPVADRALGIAYVSVGNGPSVQPFHGWLFELDLDAWRRGETAVDAVFTTTASTDCGPDNNRMPNVCGGGIWNAAGVQIIEETSGDYTLLAATGNGRIDFDRNSYAYSILRLPRGLAFDRACDESLCADFDDNDAPLECIASCDNVFVAHLPPGETVDPEDGTCDGLTFTECLHALDGDLGASMPVVVQPVGGPRVIVQPGKDGGLYLVDYDHLGTLYERRQEVDFCGTAEDACGAFWMGMFVTQPAVTTIDGDPWVIVVSTMFDHTHPSGIHALRVVMRDGAPRFESMWQVPGTDSEEALDAFRQTAGRPLIVDIDGEPFVFVVDRRVANDGEPGAFPGVLYGVRVRDGALMFRERIPNAGQRFALPLYYQGRLHVNTCGRAGGEGQVLAYDLVLRVSMLGPPFDKEVIWRLRELAIRVGRGTRACLYALDAVSGDYERAAIWLARPEGLPPREERLAYLVRTQKHAWIETVSAQIADFQALLLAKQPGEEVPDELRAWWLDRMQLARDDDPRRLLARRLGRRGTHMHSAVILEREGRDPRDIADALSIGADMLPAGPYWRPISREDGIERLADAAGLGLALRRARPSLRSHLDKAARFVDTFDAPSTVWIVEGISFNTFDRGLAVIGPTRAGIAIVTDED